MRSTAAAEMAVLVTYIWTGAGVTFAGQCNGPIEPIALGFPLRLGLRC
jgi:hypothetical protein